MLNAGLFSSARGDWATPREIFDALNAEFHFDLDPCAEPATAKCERFYSGIEGLLRPWEGRVFVNPPYGRSVGKWVQRCPEAIQNGAEIVVALLPSRTDTHWWHEWVLKASEIRFVRGRIYFERPDGFRGRAPFPSAIVVWRGEEFSV